MTDEEFIKYNRMLLKKTAAEERKLNELRAQESCYTCARRGKEKIFTDSKIGFYYPCAAWGKTGFTTFKSEKCDLKSSTCNLWKSSIPSLFDESETPEELEYKVKHYHELYPLPWECD